MLPLHLEHHEAVGQQNQVKPTTMTAPEPPPAARSLGPVPQHAVSRPSRNIQYILLDNCRNIPAHCGLTHGAHSGSASCHPVDHFPSTDVGFILPLPKDPPVFLTFPIPTRKPAQGSKHSLSARKRLPVFRRLCGEHVPSTDPTDESLETSSHEENEQPKSSLSTTGGQERPEDEERLWVAPRATRYK
ncbi:UNVERIFIED_CONTAM: hypothetical protein H355_016491 [Colinus virginianus]|nr:hypothetical protein H355_016491 [Colinus virginianus]